VIGPPPIANASTNKRIKALSEGMAAVCRDRGVPFLDVFRPLRASREWMDEVAAGDGAHPSADGYRVLAALVDDWPPWRNAID
jgi:lysophospholipase L1-like esterase